LISIFVWYFFGIQESVTFLALFAVLGLRIQPGISRIQNCFLMIRQHLPQADGIVEMEKFYRGKTLDQKTVPASLKGGADASIKVILEKVSFGAEKNNLLVENLNFTFQGPGLILIKGSNGVGKSTLLEVICGLRIPQSGVVSYELNSEGKDTKSIVNVLSYLPQKIAILDTNLQENLTLGSSKHMDPLLAQKILRNFDFFDTSLNMNARKYFRPS
jgi:ABC-type bacteriocin/lantibiotic exporter with double-glycine peptidase domain